MTTTVSEATFKLSDGLDVYTKTWSPAASAPLAEVILIHGFSDHCNAYYLVPTTLAARGIEVFSFDQRGWGRTSGSSKAAWGATGPTSQTLADFDELLQARLDARPDIPCFLLGHSMGGGNVLTYAAQGKLREKLAGTVAWSPMVDFAPETRPMPGVVSAGKVAAKFMPGKKMLQKLDPSFMSRDAEVNREFDADPLCHDTGTLQGIAAMIDRGRSLMKLKKFDVDRPLLVLHGSGDKICSHKASKAFVDGLEAKDKLYVEYDGWYHKLHAEPGQDRSQFANDIAVWFLARIPGNRGSSAGGSKL